MRPALIAVALIACQGHKDEPPKPAPASDPWAAAPASDAPPSIVERARHANAACPRVVAPYFFEIDKAGAKSYLLGTHHVSVPLAKMPDVVRDRLHAAKLIVLETPGDSAKTTAPDLDLPSELGAKDWQHYTELVGHSLARTVAHGRPSTAMLMMMFMYEDLGAALDNEIASTAGEAHVPRRGLESDQFQDDLIEKLMDMRMLRVEIEQTKDRHELETQSSEELQRYCTGVNDTPGFGERDEKRLLAGGYSRGEIDTMLEKLVFARNAKWIPELEDIFTTGGAFVAVGSDHLIGKRGVVELLRGWTVTRVAP